MSQTITQQPIIKKDKTDYMLLYAMEIAIGKAGIDVIYCLEEDRFYVYKEGYWQHIFEIDILSAACTTLAKINKYTIARKKQILENLKVIKNIHLEKFNNLSFINLENGMFDPIKVDKISWEESQYSTIRIPYKYDKEAKCGLWIKTLNEILEDDQNKINVLQEFFGYCLTRDTTQHKALLLLGESRSGKSTILQTLRGIIGDKNCSSVPLKFISHPQYTPMLINKLVNIDTDVSARATEFEAEFKTITSGEPVSCNQKFIAAFDFRPYCKIVMAANIFPRITDHSSAFYKRLILIPCDRVFSEEEQNRNLLEQLKEEYSGILNWAVEGLQRLKQRGRFEIKNFMDEAVQELRDESNPVDVFFRENIEIDKEKRSHIEKKELYQIYVKWCEVNGHKEMSMMRFCQALYQKYCKYTDKKSQDFITGRRVWKNLKLINEITKETEQIKWKE